MHSRSAKVITSHFQVHYLWLLITNIALNSRMTVATGIEDGRTVSVVVTRSESGRYSARSRRQMLVDTAVDSLWRRTELIAGSRRGWFAARPRSMVPRMTPAWCRRRRRRSVVTVLTTRSARRRPRPWPWRLWQAWNCDLGIKNSHRAWLEWRQRPWPWRLRQA